MHVTNRTLIFSPFLPYTIFNICLPLYENIYTSWRSAIVFYSTTSINNIFYFREIEILMITKNLENFYDSIYL